MSKKYFDVHLTIIPRVESFSVPVECELDNEYNDEDVVSEAVNQGKIDPDDIDFVDYVEEIDLDDFEDMRDLKPKKGLLSEVKS